MAHKSYADLFFFSKKCVCHAKLSLYLNQIFAKDSFFLFFIWRGIIVIMIIIFILLLKAHFQNTAIVDAMQNLWFCM